MATRIVKFGVGNVVEKDFPEGATIQQVVGDAEVRGKLGLSSDLSRYDAFVQGVNVPMDRLAPPESVISLHSRQCTKN